MFCKHCGAKNNDNSKSCSECGEKLFLEDSSRKIVFRGEIHKCPNCGDTVEAFESICDSCGHELNSTAQNTVIESFLKQYKEIENKKNKKGLGKSLFEKIGIQDKEQYTLQKIDLIKGFPVPNNTEDLFEFLIFATTHINTELALAEDYEDLTPDYKENFDDLKAINTAWIEKAEQIHQKCILTSRTHPKFNSVESIYLKKINKIENNKIKKEKNKKRNIKIAIISLISILIAAAIIVPIVYILLDVKVNIRDSAESYIGRELNQVLIELEDFGFKNIELKEVEILSSDTSKESGQIQSLTVDGKNDFISNDEFLSRSKVVITYYVVKYIINLRIEFYANLLLNKYDVNLYINDVKKEKIEHGQSIELQVRMNEGKNTISFFNTEDKSIEGTIILMVTGDLNVTYRISANKNNVDIDEISKENLSNYNDVYNRNQSKISYLINHLRGYKNGDI